MLVTGITSFTPIRSVQNFGKKEPTIYINGDYPERWTNSDVPRMREAIREKQYELDHDSRLGENYQSQLRDK